jgi:hypothetical protein
MQGLKSRNFVPEEKEEKLLLGATLLLAARKMLAAHPLQGRQKSQSRILPLSGEERKL